MRCCAEMRFVEDISPYFEQRGLPRTAGRVLELLLICDQPAQSLTDLCELVQTSKSSANKATGLLTEMDLIERVPLSLPRQFCCQFRPGGWTASIRQLLKLWALLRQITESGLELPHGRDADLGIRLQEAHDMFWPIEEELPAVLERVQRRRNR